MNHNGANNSSNTDSDDWTDLYRYYLLVESIRHVAYFYISPLICVPGCLANALVIVTMTRKRISSGIGVLICGLAAYDGLYLAFNMSAFLIKTKHSGAFSSPQYWYATIAFFNISFVFRAASSYTCVFISFERYIAMCHPLKARLFCSVQVAWTATWSILVVSILMITPYWMYFDGHSAGDISYQTFMCFYALILAAVLPVIIIIVFSGLSVRALVISKFRNARKRSQGNRVTAVMLLMIACFLVLIFPTCIVQAIVVTDLQRLRGNPVFQIAETVGHLLMMLNSAINFLLYCVAGSRFRAAFVEWVQNSSIGLTETNRKFERSAARDEDPYRSVFSHTKYVTILHSSDRRTDCVAYRSISHERGATADNPEL